jgi:hypothetical protein
VWRWLGVLAGCGGGGAPEGDPPRTWEGDFLLDEIVIDCDTSGWTYDVRTQGWGELITVDVVAREFGALIWSEHHELPEVEYGEDWARHRLELDQVYEEADYVSSETTWLACEAKTFVTYGFAAWRQDDEMQECAAWGVDPEGEFPDCVNWGETGH